MRKVSLKTMLRREMASSRPSLDEMKGCWSEVMGRFGYLVIGTKPGVAPFTIGEIVTNLWEYEIGQPFQVVALTDQAEYDAHIDFMQSIRPNWPKIARADYFGEGGSFYRVATD